MTLGEAFPIELETAREKLQRYEALGSAGVFACMLIRNTIKRAEIALANSDILAMIELYGEMRDISW